MKVKSQVPEPTEPSKPKKRMNFRAKGARRERYFRDLALGSGAVLVIKAGASLGAADLALDFPTRTIRAQAKSNAWPGTEESNGLDFLAAKLDQRFYIVATVRIDDGIARGKASVDPKIRCRIHRGPGMTRVECTWGELVAVACGEDMHLLLGDA